jgi:hypothetical protein
MKALLSHPLVPKCFARHREMCALCSPREFEVYTALFEKRWNAAIAPLKAEVAKCDQLRAEIEKRKFALWRLAEHERAKLSTHMLTNYCRLETHVDWPHRGILPAITERVVNYLKFTGERLKRPRPSWRAFQIVDKRLPSLQLVAQVDQLASCALARLREDPPRARDARPLILWFGLVDHPAARQLMKFDPSARYVLKKLKQRITDERVRAKREAAKERKRRQRSLTDSRGTASR